MTLTKWKIGTTEGMHPDSGLILLDGKMDRVVSLVKEQDGKVTFREESDGYFCVTMTKEEAKKALLEAITWIDGDDS